MRRAASHAHFSCYKPVAMTKFSSGLARSSMLALLLCLGGCAIFSGGGNETADTGGGGRHHRGHGANGTAVLPPADILYQQGVAHIQKQQFSQAVTSFNQVEENYPYSVWATHAQLLAGYAQYKQQDYDDALSSLNRFIALHPENEDAAYAYYLKALCYYEQIDDVQRDQTATYEAIQALSDLITRFPDSAYSRDARIKLRLADNRLAGHDMVIGRFYEKNHLYAAAINSYEDVITNYQTTTDVPEALERLVECDLDLGLTEAAQRTAAVLAYNFPGSSWYQAAYAKLKAHGLVQNAAATPAHKSHGLF
jgi:outer membrane protein assembly factor BamD